MNKRKSPGKTNIPCRIFQFKIRQGNIAQEIVFSRAEKRFLLNGFSASAVFAENAEKYESISAGELEFF